MTDYFGDVDADGGIDLDFTDAQDPSAMAAGLYPARVVEADVHNSANSDLPTLYLTFEVLGPEGSEGRKMRFTSSLKNDKISRGFLRVALKALGIPAAELVAGWKLHPMDLLDRECTIRVALSTYLGEPSASISRLYPLGRSADTKVAEAAPFANGGGGIF